MLKKQCPKCGASCDVSETNLELGSPIRCACGCNFEVLPGTLQAQNSRPTQSPPTAKRAAPQEERGAPHGQTRKRRASLRGSLAPLFPVAVGVLLVYALWVWNWPKLLFVASVCLTIFCWRRKRAWKLRDQKSLTYLLFDKSVEFFVPLTAVLIFYAILSLVVDGASDRATLGRLEGLERSLDSLYSYLAWLKLKPLVAASVIAAVTAIDFSLSLFFKYRDLAFSWYKTYGLWSKRVSTVVVLLCCFTFFGNAVAKKRAHLRSRTDKIREGYARLREESEEILADSVRQRLYDKVHTAYFPDVLSALNELKKTDKKIEDLRVSLKYADALGVKDDNAVEIIRRYDLNNEPALGSPEEPLHYSEAEPQPRSESLPLTQAPEPPPETTEASVVESVAEADAKLSFRSRLISLIKMDGTKQLFCQFPKSFTGAAKSAAFKSAMLKYPMLEPVVDVFAGTFDKAVEQKVKASADRVADALLRSPQKANTVVSEEAEKIVGPLEVKKTTAPLERIKKSAATFEESLQEIDEATKSVSKLMNSAAAARAADPPPQKNNSGSSTPGVWMCSCYCGSRLMWGPITVSWAAQCHAMCPPMPCA
jgi:hypothetical protein